MNIFFTKQALGVRDGHSMCDVLVSVNKKYKHQGKDSLVVRLSGDLLKRAGWKLGDRCILGYHGTHWTLEKTNDQEKGFKVTRSSTSNTKTGNIKLTLNKDKQIQIGMLPGDRHECDAREVSSERIVAVVRK